MPTIALQGRAAPSHWARALERQTGHSFVPGRGYVEHSDPPAIVCPSLKRGRGAEPPQDSDNLTEHWLEPPHGAATMVFVWLANERGWKPKYPSMSANRMAWTVEYLSSAGWLYKGPVA